MQGPTILADGIIEASVAHGVARITLAQSGADGKPKAVGQIAIPLSQLPAMTQALTGLVQQVETKLREQQAAAAPASLAATPAAFRFG
jgi:hypothetical protein